MAPRLLLLLALAAVVPLAAAGQEPPRIDLPVKVTRDIPFAAVGGQTLKLDLAAPYGRGPHPAVVLFHGGAWVMGNRADLTGFLPDIAAKGYVVASASYRLAPKHP